MSTARGGIIDETALHAALTDGTLPAAALDVFDREPPDPANPLFKLPNMIASPHIAGVTAEAMDRMSVEAAKNVLCGLRRRTAQGECDQSGNLRLIELRLNLAARTMVRAAYCYAPDFPRNAFAAPVSISG